MRGGDCKVAPYSIRQAISRHGTRAARTVRQGPSPFKGSASCTQVGSQNPLRRIENVTREWQELDARHSFVTQWYNLESLNEIANHPLKMRAVTVKARLSSMLALDLIHLSDVHRCG